jgi:DNA-binding transcriptional MocR family regulator
VAVGELLANQPAAREELERLPLGYPGLHGSPALRALVALRYAGLSAEHILVTSGTDDALALVLLACLERGDHLIIDGVFGPHRQRTRSAAALMIEMRARR